jgi:hypothetical protein
MVVPRLEGADMRQAAALVLVGLWAVVLPFDRVLACGDKLLLTGRDFPYVRAYAAIHPAAIAIYLPKAAHKGAGADLASLLRRAGHDADVITDAPRLTRLLKLGQIDVVLANMVNIDAVETASADCESHPALLPMLDSEVSSAAYAAAKSRYPFALKAPETASRFLGTIDKAMGDRPSHASRKKH